MSALADVLTRLEGVYGARRAPTEQARIEWARALSDMPDAQLVEACDRMLARRRARSWPTPGELRSYLPRGAKVDMRETQRAGEYVPTRPAPSQFEEDAARAADRACIMCHGTGLVFDSQSDPRSTDSARDAVRGRDDLLVCRRGYCLPSQSQRPAVADLYRCVCVVGGRAVEPVVTKRHAFAVRADGSTEDL